MRRFSIRTLMAFVLVSAVGLAALRNANEVWAGWLLTGAFGAVATAVLGALVFRDGPRYRWAGFVVFSGGYLALTVGPGLSDAFKPYLGTTRSLNYVQSQVTAASSSRLPQLQTQRARIAQRIGSLVADDPDFISVTNRLATRLATLDASIKQERASQISGSRWRWLLPGAVNQDQFLCVGHSLFALLAGLMGNMVAA